MPTRGPNNVNRLWILWLCAGLAAVFLRPLPADAAPAAKRIVTDNGMTVLIQEAHSIPVVNIQVIIKAGSIRDPEDKAGLAHLTAALLDEGTATRSSVQIADAIDFIWPAKGRVLAGFSEPRSKGVDIEGKPGDPVLAAAAGRVMYTGTGIRGYGKLIVIKHDNNFNSVYAHNREILVKEGQNVTRGQRIAELGDTDADAPKLHFEIRKSGKPVDPARYLPPS